jgi:hypothetical protein
VTMPRFLVHHHHEAKDCGVAFASFKGHASPLRHHETFSSCLSGGHAVWWLVDAASEHDALALLPPYVAARASAAEVRPVQIP